MITNGASDKGPVMIGVAGCSGSGKTTLAVELARVLGAVHFHFDSYYRDLSHLPPQERAVQDFDDPAMLEEPLLVAHLRALAQGKPIERPVYDFATHVRIPGVQEQLWPGGVLVVEGIFALHYPEIVDLYHLRVFVETADELCFERRLRRDTQERGRSPESVRQQYDATVRPSGIRFVQPSARHAHLIVDGANALERNVDQVLAELRKRSLL